MNDVATGISGAELTFSDAYKLYEDGKHRRYDLLFAVNGGAFAIAKFIGDKPGLGALRLPHIAIGMALFTATMVADIYMFGMKWNALGNQISSDARYTIFGSQGRAVLLILGGLICAAWILASGIFL
jgi:hypothetical protein